MQGNYKSCLGERWQCVLQVHLIGDKNVKQWLNWLFQSLQYLLGNVHWLNTLIEHSWRLVIIFILRCLQLHKQLGAFFLFLYK